LRLPGRRSLDCEREQSPEGDLVQPKPQSRSRSRIEPKPPGGATDARRPIVAAGLSLLTSGLGQLYNGELIKGMALFVAVGSLWFAWRWTGLRENFTGFAVGLAMLVLAALIIGYSTIDAFLKARRERSYRLKAYNRWYLYLLLMAIMGLIGLGAPGLSAGKTYRYYQVSSGSMQPTLQIGDYVVVGLGVYDAAPPERGEIVVYRYPPDPSRDFVLRVVGLPGESLSMVDRRLFVNGEALEEPYAHFSESPGSPVDPRRDDMPSTVVPEGHCFVMGDDRDNSHDSRFWGPLPMESLRGRPLYIYWSRDRSRIGRSLLP
jgi:signal peptidase I